MASDSSSSGIVEDWLKSLNMIQYTQAFLDNGYDDLEVCKQIGEDDLDAIGIPKDHQREVLLRAVKMLREEGGAVVYFTLEESDNCQISNGADIGNGNDDPSCTSAGIAAKCIEALRLDSSAQRMDAYDMGKNTIVTYPKVQLKLILRDKLVQENIDLSESPYTNSDLVICSTSLTALAMRFAQELSTHFMDVLEGLEELWMVARSNDMCSDMCVSPSRSVYGGSQTFYYGYPHQYLPHYQHYTASPRTQPPPLPSCPPPATMSNAYMDRCSSLQSHLDSVHVRLEPPTYQNYVAFDGGTESTGISDDKKKGGSVFGRFLRNIGFRKSTRKGSYNKYQGDLSAYEISMGDEDRMALMILVKEGKISTQTALAVVQRFEEERRAAGRVGASDGGKENVCDTPSKKGAGKKKKCMKAMKSQSTLSADDPRKGTKIASPAERELYDHQMCRQRRVHSLGQLDVSHIRPQLDQQHNQQRDRISLTRAMSCSPSSTHNHRLTSQMEPPVLARLYSPNHHHLQQNPSHYHHHHHGLNKVDALRERLTGRPVNTVPKTSSKTSLLSSGSDQSMSMECSLAPISRQSSDCAAYNSNSTVSVTSDANSPIAGRKKTVVQDLRLKNHQTASCSPGDDGISSENDDIENRSSRLKEVIVPLPPLLRQRSAPGGSPQYSGPYLGQAKVIVDYVPGPNEKEFLPLKKGDIVNIISMAQSGVWMGVVGRKRGKFHFEHVEVVIEPDRTFCDKNFSVQKDVPKSVSDLLHKIGLGHLTTLFIVNGYDDLDIFSELDDHDLDTLHISDADQRARLLSSARVLVNWHDKMNAQPANLISMDSPSSRAGNSSCDSGCYAGGEGKQQTRCHVNENGETERGQNKADSNAGYTPSANSHHPCNYCGKPKPPRKYSGPSTYSQYPSGQYMAQTHYTPGHMLHSTGLSPYSSGHFQYVSSQQYRPYNPAHYGYHYSPNHSQYGQGHSQYALSVSRTLSQLSVTDSHNAPAHQEAFLGRKHSINPTNPVYVDKQAIGNGGLIVNNNKSGDRVSLTEEDQEVIAITYGTNEARKLATPVQQYGRSSQLEMTNIVACTACISSSGCAQCDESVLCDSISCQQCAAYMSCSQCFPYRHYTNTTMRSDSKSSKMSCSSTCTQTTCLSPDHDDSSHSGGSNLLDYTTSSQGGHYLLKPSQGKSQHCYYYQQQYMQHPVYGLMPVTSRIPTLSQLPSPVPTLADIANTPPLTLSLVDSNTIQGLTMPLQTEVPSSLAPPTDWGNHSEENESLGMATLYSRGRSQTPDKSEKGDSSQMKSPTRSLMPLVSTKLSAEMIDLTQLPYSTTIGHCGIPPLLVQRYSEELRQDVETMSIVLEQLREKQLRGLGRPCIQSEGLSESCKTACDLQISSIENFLISIGLPMYQRSLAEGGINTLEQLLKLKDSEIEQMTGADSRHLRRIAHALKWVQLKLLSPNQNVRNDIADKV